MRALLLLVVAVAAAPAPRAPSTPIPHFEDPSPALIVLRAACSRPGDAFEPHALQEYLRDRAPHETTDLHVLGYEDTCGAQWTRRVALAAAGARARGWRVAAAGWPGGAACGVLGALGGVRPRVCSRAEARARAVVHLALRLRWRRALVSTGADDICAAALTHVASALAAAGVLVHSAPEPSYSQVAVYCGSEVPATRDADAVLLLRPGDETDSYAYSTSNISLGLVNSPYFMRFKRGGQKPLATVFSIDYVRLTKKSLRSSETATLPPISTTERDEISPVARDTAMLATHVTGPGPRVSGPRLIRVARASRLVVLADVLLGPGGSRSPPLTSAFEAALDALAHEETARRTGTDTTQDLFHLYESSDSLYTGQPLAHVAELEVRGARGIRNADEPWLGDVTVVNSDADFETWCSMHALRPEAGWAALVAGAACALSATALLVGAAWALRRAHRRGGRRRRDVLLDVRDFTFPPDERRCVGEGMETMLSCWLQQLHEFGGPELERPDLLKQPPPPSAPSSTPSVNRLAADSRPRYKGDAVHTKYLPVTAALELRRKATDVLLVMQSLRHENLNPFIGCLCEARPALVFDQCGRGSLEDVLVADDIKLDWTFRLSLLTDAVRGLRYLHTSPLRVHGRLSSRNCVVDSRWVLRLTDFGLPAFRRAQGLPSPHRRVRDMLWTAPELLREWREGREARGTQPGDVFSFAIIMQEVIVRGEPYCMLALTPDEIVEKLCRPPPLIRPSVSMGAAPPEAVSVMRQCWAEAPDLRPDTQALHEIFRNLHRGRKINIVDSMFEMLEKYSNNLEELIRERTTQLDAEKRRTEQLLNRMLPRSVAERLLAGQPVQPEEFSEVTVYFSDIVGFTALAARSSPVQVVDLLNDLYTTFDAAIEQYRVYKVETIGDAYMVVGGLPARAPDHAESVATMALHLLHLAGRFRVRHLPAQPLHLRIGLHSGPCCAAVVGLTMPRYCLFGDTVNTASRMESTGAAWRIQVSAATAELLTAAGGYRLRSRGLTQVKGKGIMHTYWLLGKEGFDKPLPTPPALHGSEEVLFESDAENEAEAPPEGACAAPPADEQTHTSPPIRTDKYAWQRSGAVSADSSPPRASPATDHSAPYARYRCLGGGRSLRRQWSLERGEALAAAAGARADDPAAPAPAPPPDPPRAARYRTRPPPDTFSLHSVAPY